MELCNDIHIMNEFPDFRSPGFVMEKYNERFVKHNVIINAKTCNVSYPEHWGCLSVKCSIQGNEYYESNGRFYTVNENNYLIFNEGQSYSSHIFSSKPVESFTINFSVAFQQIVTAGLTGGLDNNSQIGAPLFVEKLYQHDRLVSPVLRKLHRLSSVQIPNSEMIREAYYELFESLMTRRYSLYAEIQKVDAVRYSTRIELYKRLNYAKDYIDSCYMKAVSLEKLASISCLNSAYLLKQFKKYFHLTPHQYLVQKRLFAASEILVRSSQSVVDTCIQVGYQDASSFNKLFKRQFGLSPEKYQQLHSKKSIFTC
jgi:AraC family transcriptional regulator